MDNAARARRRVLALFLPIAAVLYISAEALSPKGTDQVATDTATALKVLAIAEAGLAMPASAHVVTPACGRLPAVCGGNLGTAC